MANAEHVRLLKLGVNEWNHWRADNPEVKPVLQEANLIDANLRGVDLIEANLCDTDLRGADLSEANLKSADLNGANLNGTNLKSADLSEANLREANLRVAGLQGVNLQRVNLNRADLSGVDLSGSDLSNTDLSRALLNSVNLSGAKLCNANLSGAKLRQAYVCNTNLSDTDLSGANLSEVNLSGVNLRGADLRRVNLRGADVRGVVLCVANLSRLDLRGFDLSGADLRGANLSRTDLRDTNLSGANLRDADLSEVNLSRLNLSGFDLSGANLARANLTEANLSKTQTLRTQFEKTIFTGACLEDWNINSATKFDGAICEYVYLKADQQERRPREGIFKPGEFATLFQQAIDTVDLIFKDGIDWQAFFQSFQDLRNQYADQNLAIQAIEKKQVGAFVVRVEVPPESDKTAIETRAKELYASEVKALEAQYEEQLRLQGQHLEDARQTIEVERQAIEAERRDKATLMGVIQTLAISQQGPKYDLRGAQIAGGVADTVQGDQHGGQVGTTINTYGPNTEDITRLLTTLRDQAQTFPTDQKDEALDTLAALQDDLTKPEPDQPRIGRRLKKLVALGSAIARPTSDFPNKVIELTEKLGIPIEQVQ